jgi:hypothetical protein
MGVILEKRPHNTELSCEAPFVLGFVSFNSLLGRIVPLEPSWSWQEGQDVGRLDGSA